MKRKALILATLVLSVGLVAGAASEKWLNVTVVEAESNTNVKVHLPLNLVLSVLGAVDVEGLEGGKVDLHTHDVDLDWVEILTSLKSASDGEYLTVESDDADVKVTKNDNTILISVHEKTDEQAQVEVVLPAQILEAIHVDDEDRLDVAALLQAFDTLPQGDLVRVTSNEANVRIWVE